MKFEIRCKSIKEFDSEKGVYVKCNQSIEVDSSQVGTLVRCPVCGNDVEVVNAGMLGVAASQEQTVEDDAWADEPLDLSTDSGESSSFPDAATNATSQNVTSEEENGLTDDQKKDEAPIDFVTDLEPLGANRHESSAQSTPPLTLKLSGSNQDPSTELKKDSIDQADGHVLMPANFDRTNSCYKCGSLLEEKQATCPNCQAPRKAAYVEKKDRKPFSKKGPFGFQLWLDSITKRQQSSEFSWFVGLAYVFAVMLMGAGVIVTVFGGISGIFGGPLVAFAGYSLFAGLRYWGQSREHPRTPIPILGQVTWAVVLFFIRAFRFPKLSQNRMLNKNGDRSFGDKDLAEINDLSKYRIIDLEGTSITDEGLLHLYDHRGIQYLVIRNTEVTIDGAHDLQQSIPKTWIWV